jgi:hypothetical protein
MKKAKSNEKNLLAAIRREAPVAAAEETPQAESKPVSRQSGGRVHMWFQTEDRKIVRELAAWLAGQGERPSDSLIIRTALRMAKPGGGLLAAYRDAAKLDGRRKQEP